MLRLEELMAKLEFKGSSVARDLQDIAPGPSPLRDIYTSIKGVMVHKWHHYIPLYERYFSRFRGTDFRFLEIGVSKGGSLSMWRQYFGDRATIMGIDIDPDCAQFDGQAAQVRIGSQDDSLFLNQVVKEMGGVDVVLDDGSHYMRHIRASLSILFPLLSQNGLYMVEDLHTCYWPGYGGNPTGKGSFFEDILPLIHDMHTPYSMNGASPQSFGRQIGGIHIHDSLLVLEKTPVRAPVHSKVGRIDDE